MQKIKKHALSFIVFLLIIAAVQLLGSLWTFSSVKTWYPSLSKPLWNPPAYVFGPVWTTLYLMIALSGWRIFITKGDIKRKNKALTLYGMQLFFNLMWSFFFFYLRSPLLGMLDILCLLIFLFYTIQAFHRIDKTASWLLVPYLLWTVYAMTLNVALWRLN